MTLSAIGCLVFTTKHFPHQNKQSYISPSIGARLSVKSLRARLDVIGCFLLMVPSFLLVTVLLKGSGQWRWKSARSIVLLVISVVFILVFVLFERWLSKSGRKQESLFPWQLATTNRFIFAAFL